MFREPEYDVYDIIGQLYVHKVVFDSTGHYLSGGIDGDCMFSDALDAIGMVADKIEYSYVEDYDSTIHKIYFDRMYEFFELCRQLARQKGIAFQNEPYVQQAKRFIDRELQDVPDYSIGWNVYIPKKLTGNKTYSVLVELGCEFYSYVPLVDSLYNIRDYFIQQEKELRAELDKPKVIQLPKAISKAKTKTKPARRAA